MFVRCLCGVCLVFVWCVCVVFVFVCGIWCVVHVRGDHIISEYANFSTLLRHVLLMLSQLLK